MAGKKKTTHMRVYKEDLDALRIKGFVGDKGVSQPDFFRMSIRSNPFLQLEAFMRTKPQKKLGGTRNVAKQKR